MASEHDLFCLIMAGGSGTRFWPWSRAEKPKQFLAIGTERPLLVETIDRLAPLVPRSRIRIVAGREHAHLVAETMPALTENQVILEPCPRNTAPCIGLAALHVSQEAPEAVLAVMPADHHIGDVSAFLARIDEAATAAAAGKIVTLGITPTRPETGYGYIETEAKFSLEPSILPVKRFVEKPDLETAKRYLVSGRHLWNSGMFFFRCDIILEAIRTYLPELSQALDTLRPHLGRHSYHDTLTRLFKKLEGISIDYGIMEPLSQAEGGIDLCVIPSDIEWNDVGHWSALTDFADLDDAGNVRGQADLLVSCSNSVFQTDSGMIAAIGISDLVVVKRGDVVLVCPRERAQDVRLLVDMLKGQGRDDMV
ncbi:MAG: mannose-1-phosphate guanylyltransferase [Myxococcota bacterium]|nr:mannose-1-phosphate guanylyltransferase [Myxococcota bacterium]